MAKQDVSEKVIQEKIKRIKEIYAEFCSLINSLRGQQNKIIKQVLTRSEQAEMQRLIKKLGKIKTEDFNK